MISGRNRHSGKWKQLLLVMGTGAIVYISACLLLFFGQRYLLYRPKPNLSMLPKAREFQLPYEDVWIPIAGSRDRLHGWWVPSPAVKERYAVLADEPVSVLTTAKTMHYRFASLGFPIQTPFTGNTDNLETILYIHAVQTLGP